MVPTGCGSFDESSGDVSSREGRSSDPTFLAARDLPDGFPVDEVPVLAGRIVHSKTGEAAGAPPGKDAWAIEVAVDGDADECFQAAVAALQDRGFKETQSYNEGPGRQAFLTSKSYNVIVSAMVMSGDATLWYAVGPDGLRFAG